MPALTTLNQAAADAPQNVPLFFVYLDVAGDPLLAWSGRGNLTISSAADPLLVNPVEFIGAGEVADIGQITHAADGSVQSMDLILNNADLSQPDALNFVNNVATWSQRQAVVWQAFGRTGGGGSLLIDAPFRIMTARMMHVGIVNGSRSRIAVKLSARSAIDGQRASSWRLADAHQQAFFSGDRALSFIPALTRRELRFGVRDNTPAPGFGGDGNIPREIGPADQGGQRWAY